MSFLKFGMERTLLILLILKSCGLVSFYSYGLLDKKKSYLLLLACAQ